MNMSFSILLLAAAVSLDSFSVGFTYGLKEMKIPLKSAGTIHSVGIPACPTS